MIPDWPTIVWGGRDYIQCPSCKGWGPDGYAHACKVGKQPHGNWHSSPQAFEAAEKKRLEEIRNSPSVMTAEVPDASP